MASTKHHRSWLTWRGAAAACVLVSVVASAIVVGYGFWALPAHQMNSRAANTALMHMFSPSFQEGVDHGVLRIAQMHSSTFLLFLLNGAVTSITKLTVFFHSPARNGMQGLHEVYVGVLDHALGLNMTDVSGVVVNVPELMNSGAMEVSPWRALWRLLISGALWVEPYGVFAVGARMRFEQITIMRQDHVVKDMEFITSAAKVMILDEISAQHDRDETNCYTDPGANRLLAIDNGGSMDRFGESTMDFGTLLRRPGCLYFLIKPQPHLAGFNSLARGALDAPPHLSLACAAAGEVARLLGERDLGGVARRISRHLHSDSLITWYLAHWRQRSKDSRPWHECLVDSVGLSTVEYYQEHVEPVFGVPPGDLCGIDLPAWWANLLQLRMERLLAVARSDVQLCGQARQGEQAGR